MRRSLLGMLAVLVGASCALGAITVPGADGSDGTFTFVGDVGNANTMTIDLSAAPTATWNGTNPNPGQGKGVYDPEKWAVVFRYSGDVTIPSGKTVVFKNHPSGAPVVWLLPGNLAVVGTLSLDGSKGVRSGGLAAGGPGAFRGGQGGVGGYAGSDGCGVGGGRFVGNYVGDGSYATLGSGLATSTYGNGGVVPLIGGSGGGSYHSGDSGGGGGGAILIAAGGGVLANGVISASGGSCSYMGGGGSGGAIRIVSDTVSGSGRLQAVGAGQGGDGRIRIEANTVSLSYPGAPTVSLGQPEPVAELWPAATAPRITATTIGGQSIPADPRPLLIPNYDVAVSSAGPVVLRIEAVNVPTNWIVTARIVPLSGTSWTVTASLMSEDGAKTVWETPVTLTNGLSAVYVRARKP